MAAASALATLVGCSSSPTPRFYAIRPLASSEVPAGAVAPAASGALAISVGPVTIPRYLERPQIVVREKESRLSIDEVNRWGGSLETEILRVLGENLGALLDTDRIVVYPQRAPFPTSYGVRLDFERFEGQRGEAFVLKARWVVQAGRGGEALAVEVSQVREPLDGSGVSELVRAHGAALSALSLEIATRIRELDAQARAGGPAGAFSAARSWSRASHRSRRNPGPRP